MPLSEQAAIAKVKQLMDLRVRKQDRLDLIREYITDDPDRRVRFLPAGVPKEVRELAHISRVNMLRFVVRAAYQNMYVEGYRAPRANENAPAWSIWQENQMDARQIGVHKAALTYGESFVTVLPGKSRDSQRKVPVMRGVSPRNLTSAWGDDDVWPELALERRLNGWRLYDSEAVYEFEDQRDSPDGLRLLSVAPHDAGVTPVIRYRETSDLDDPVVGLVKPLIALQDQINVTTFGLMVAQHFGAFKQRWVIGWLAETELEQIKVSASRLMSFEDTEVKVGEFAQTDLSGYIDSREATLRHLSTVSQTPAHELLGQLVNLSAEALAAAEASSRRASTEYRTVIGESHEQALALAGQLIGQEPDPSAEARWRATESHALAALVDALSKAAQMLGVPQRAMWEPFADAIGASQTEIERWESLRTEEDAVATVLEAIERQGRPAGAGVG